MRIWRNADSLIDQFLLFELNLNFKKMQQEETESEASAAVQDRVMSVECLYSIEELMHLCKEQNLVFGYTVDVEYEVESIIKFRCVRGVREFFVKWKDWPNSFNSWVREENLNCVELMLEYLHKNNMQKESCRLLSRFIERECLGKEGDVFILSKLLDRPIQSESCSIVYGNTLKELKRSVRALLDKPLKKLKVIKNFKSPYEFVEVVYQRKALVETMRKWELEINKQSKDPAPLFVENFVDLELPPLDFTYISDYQAGKRVEIPTDPPLFCDCKGGNCFEERKRCGNVHGETTMGYSKKIENCMCCNCCIKYELNLYENQNPNTCIDIYIETTVVSRTSNGRGWGVRTLQPIKKHAFVMEYLGEVIKRSEASRREELYSAHTMTYMFELDYNNGEPVEYVVDAAKFGNVAHFLNHSCDPNLQVVPVWINNLMPSMPRLGFFATRHIRKFEELTFDYKMHLVGGETSEYVKNQSTMNMTADALDKSGERGNIETVLQAHSTTPLKRAHTPSPEDSPIIVTSSKKPEATNGHREDDVVVSDETGMSRDVAVADGQNKVGAVRRLFIDSSDEPPAKRSCNDSKLNADSIVPLPDDSSVSSAVQTTTTNESPTLDNNGGFIKDQEKTVTPLTSVSEATPVKVINGDVNVIAKESASDTPVKVGNGDVIVCDSASESPVKVANGDVIAGEPASKTPVKVVNGDVLSCESPSINCTNVNDEKVIVPLQNGDEIDRNSLLNDVDVGLDNVADISNLSTTPSNTPKRHSTPWAKHHVTSPENNPRGSVARIECKCGSANCRTKKLKKGRQKGTKKPK